MPPESSPPHFGLLPGSAVHAVKGRTGG